MSILPRLLAAFALVFALAAPAFSQSSDAQAEEDKGRFLTFVENQLSTDNRIIRVSGIEGALSSRATIDLITVADAEGVWLRLENNVIDWSRSQLLRGRLDIERLAAGRIEVLRTPVPDPNAVPSPEAGGFSIPELPLTIEIDDLEVGELFLAEPLIGEEATVNIRGSVALADGGLDAALKATRLDGAGGQLALTLGYSPDSERVVVDFLFDEPEGGIVATLAGIEGEPAVTFRIAGEGTLDDLTVNVDLDAANRTVLSGAVQLAGTPEGRRIVTDLDGALGPLLPASVREFVGASSTLDLVAIQREGGGLTLERIDLNAGEVQVSGSARTAADGFLELLDLSATVAADDEGTGEPTTLPGGTRIAGAELNVDYDAGQGNWSAVVRAVDIDAGTLGAGEAAIQANGTIENPNDPATRRVTFTFDGDLRQLAASDPALAAALGSAVRFDASGAYASGQPMEIQSAAITAKTLRAVLSGVLDGTAFEGDAELGIASLAPFSELAGRDLAGSLALDANGRIAPLTGAFDLTLDAKANGLETGIAQADELLGDVTITGGVTRDETGTTARDLVIDGEKLDIRANGTIASENADFQAMLDLADLAALSDQASGAASIEANITGAEGVFDLALTGSIPEGSLTGRELRDASFGFDGNLRNGDVTGQLTADARLSGEPVTLSGEIATLGDIRQIEGLDFQAGDARLTGAVRQNPDGLLEGELELDADDISTVAALGLTEATGAADATIALAPRVSNEGVRGQGADVTASLRDLVVGEARVGSANLVANADRLFSVPAIEATLNASDVRAGGVVVSSLEAEANTVGDRTVFEADAELDGGATASVAGSLTPIDQAADADEASGDGEAPSGGFAIELTRLLLTEGEQALRLLDPTRVTVLDGVTTLDGLAVAIGQGTLRASGRIAETLDLSLELDAVGLDVVDAVRPDLELGGTVSGEASVRGTPAAPEAEFAFQASNVSLALLRQADVPELDAVINGEFSEGALMLQTARVEVGSDGVVEGNAAIPVLPGSDMRLMANLSITELPLALANGFREDLGAAGTLNGVASVTGSLAMPEATFRANVDAATAAPLRDAGIEPLALSVSGSFMENMLRLAELSVANPQGIDATAEGTVPLAGSGLDITLDISRLPLAIGGVALPSLEPRGTLRGTAQLTGTLREPRGPFDVTIENASVAPLREAAIAPLDARVAGELTAQGIELERARVVNEQGLSVEASGTVPLGADDPIALTLDIAALPLALADVVRPELDASGIVSGTASVNGSLNAIDELDVTFDVEGSQLSAAPIRSAGIEPLDASLEGRFRERRVVLDNARVTNPQGLSVSAEGSLPLSADGEIDIEASVEALPLAVANAVRPELDLAGTVSGTADLSGPLTSPSGTFDINARDLTAAPLRSNGIAPLRADLAGELSTDSVRLTSGRIANDQGISATVEGTLPLSADGPIDVDVALDEFPLSIANAARPDLDLAGRVSGTASIEGTLAAPTGTFDIAGREVSAAPLSSNGILPLDLDASGSTDGRTLTLRQARVTNEQGIAASASGTVPLSADGAIDLNVSLDAVPLSVANAARPELELQGSVSGSASVSGTLGAPEGTFDVSARDVSAAPLRDAGIAPLDLDASGSSDGRTVRLASAEVSNPQGIDVRASGTVPLSATGDANLDIVLGSLPLSVADAVRPDLALDGTISGTASLSGPLTSPRGSFDIAGRNINAAPLRANGIAPLSLDVAGQSDGSRLRLTEAVVRNSQGISIDASGTVPVGGSEPLAVDVSLNALPLSVVNAARPGLDLSGTITGSADVSGSLANPDVTFDLAGNAISAAPLRQNGISPVSLDAAGSFANNEVRLARLDLGNGQGIDVEASGRVPLDGGALGVQLQARAPLSLADRFLVDRGARVGGSVEFSGSVTGPISDPSVNGLVSTQGATFTDPLTNLRLTSLDVLASVRDNRITFNSTRGVIGSGGTVSLEGTLDLDPASGIPANLVIVLDGVRYTDGRTLVATADGRLTVTGALLRSPLLAGTVDVIEANITIADGAGASSDIIDVVHILPPSGVLATLEKARVRPSSGGTPTPRTRPSVVQLDVTVNAPNRIFVRGRGLDAEVGGRVVVRGPVTAVRPTGAFELIRGRLSILGQRITFERGTVTLIGDLDPLINFVATTEVEDTTITIEVTGRASELEINFRSDPDLPQDEVLARLIFGRGLDELSPLQIARLAAAAAELAGGGPGVFSGLREATGLDDLDVTTDAEGNAAVRAGRYVNDNIYLGVEAGAGGGRVTIDLDITDDLKARATTGPDESTLGVFFEKDF